MRRAEPQTAAPQGPPRTPAGLAVTNLLNDLATLGPLLERAARTEQWLDAYLVCAGLNQIAEDFLHDAPYPLDDAAALLQQAPTLPGRIAGRLIAGAARLARCLWHGTAVRRTNAWQRRLAELLEEIADRVVSGAPASALGERCRQTAGEIPSLPERVRRAVVRLPACFHDLDQRPEDLERLADRFCERPRDRGRPLLVVGVRTSGSYLAPLLAAALRARDRAGTRVLTIRPGRALFREERALVRSVARAGGVVLLTDDPPVTGSSLAAAATTLERLGVPRASVVLLLSLEGDSAVPPPAVAGYDAVVLPQQQWRVHTRLHADAVASDLASLMDGELEIEAIEQLPLSAVTRGRHRRALFRVRGHDRADPATRELHVLAGAVGAGYFGAAHLHVIRSLGAFAPRVFGLRDGVLYREWLAPERRVDPDDSELARAIARYVALRRGALRVSSDPTRTMFGQRPAWEVAGLVLSRGFARAAAAARVALVDPATRRLLCAREPSVVDGSMSPEHWFTAPDGRTVKTELSERTNWSRGLTCFDAAFDLAGVAATSRVGELAERVSSAWLRETGEHVEPERWLLYELVHQWGRHRARPSCEAEVRQASARAAQRYFARVLLADVARGATGPLCALDIDGVLETEQLGFPTLTRASATSLRALLAHGYRPVPVTGRGLSEVEDRCRAYGLAGGVAEYGSAVWIAEGARALTLLNGDSIAALDRLREMLAGLDGVCLDAGFAHAVRAYRVHAGRRSPLGAAEIREAVEAAGGPRSVQVIAGEQQTDFVAAGIDKGAGLRLLAEALAGGDPSASAGRCEVAMAIGDSASDAPMLALARSSFVPAHAHRDARAAGATRVRRPYQAGLRLAVGALLGHRPGDCPRCRPPRGSGERELLLDLLSVAEDGRRGLAVGAVRIARRLR